MVNFNAFYDRICNWCGQEFNLKEAIAEGDIEAEQGVQYCSQECRDNAAFAKAQDWNKEKSDKQKVKNYFARRNKIYRRKNVTNQKKRQTRLNNRLSLNPNKVK